MKRKSALLLALAADAIQWLIIPLIAVLGLGLFLDAALDIFMALILTALRGFHWAYLPTFLGKFIPGINLVPLWTMAVLITWKEEPFPPAPTLSAVPPPLPSGMAAPLSLPAAPPISPHKNTLIVAATVVLVVALLCVTSVKLLDHFIANTKSVLSSGVEGAAKVAEKFKTGTITTTFISTATTIQSSPGGILEVASLETNETFRREDSQDTAWGAIYLGTTVSEIHTPVTYRYDIRLSDPWHLAVKNNVCIVQAPAVFPSLPPAIHLDQLEKKTEAGWLRFNAEDNLAALEKSLTTQLTLRARAHLGLVRDKCRQSVAEFVKNWLLRENQWREDRFTAIIVVFPDEVPANSDQNLEHTRQPPTIQLN